jgi:polar amino acid transport system permease protein
MGFDWGAVVQYAPFLIQAAGLSLVISALALAIAVVAGLALAFMRLSSNNVVSGLSWTYVWLVRGTPLLLQIFLIFYGLPSLGIRLPPFEAGVIALGLNSAAYFAEIFRAAIQAVPTGQVEAANAVGMMPAQAMRRIVLPLAVRPALPPSIGQSTTLVKNSSLVSVISVPDLMLTTQSIYSSTYKVWEILGLAGVLYLAMTTILQFVQTWAEKRLGYYQVR